MCSTSFLLSLSSTFLQISDQALPDLIGRALVHNANAVIQLAATQDKLHSLEQRHGELSEEYAAVSRMQV